MHAIVADAVMLGFLVAETMTASSDAVSGIFAAVQFAAVAYDVELAPFQVRTVPPHAANAESAPAMKQALKASCLEMDLMNEYK
jgi:hypothetical protein